MTSDPHPAGASTSDLRSRNRRAAVAGPLLASVVVIAGFAGTVTGRVPWEPDETTYTEVAREMLASRDWLVPRLNGQAYTHKPPLYIWAIASLRSLGLSWSAAGILPAVLSFLAVVWLMPWLARATGLDESVGQTSAVVVASLPFFSALGLVVRMDMTLVAVLTAALACLARLVGLAHAPPTRATHLGFWLLLGVGVLTKGPVALALPLLAAIVYCTVARPRPSLRPVFAGWGPAVAAAVVLAWLVPAWLAGGSAYLYQIVVVQSAGRMSSSFAHAYPPYYYLVVFPLAGLPFSFAMAVASYHGLRSRSSSPQLYLSTFVCTLFLFFSAVSGKLSVYLLPAFPPAALLLVDAIRRRRGGLRAALGAGAVGTALIGAALPFVHTLRPSFPAIPVAPLLAAGAAAAVALVALLMTFRAGWLDRCFATLAIAGLLWPVTVLPLLVRPLDHVLSLRQAALEIRDAEPGESQGLTFGDSFSGLSLHAERVFHQITSTGELRDALRAGRLVGMYARDLDAVAAEVAPEVLGVTRYAYVPRPFAVVRGAGPATRNPDRTDRSRTPDGGPAAPH